MGRGIMIGQGPGAWVKKNRQKPGHNAEKKRKGLVENCPWARFFFKWLFGLRENRITAKNQYGHERVHAHFHKILKTRTS
jgi:hypothetical protein